MHTKQDALGLPKEKASKKWAAKMSAEISSTSQFTQKHNKQRYNKSLIQKYSPSLH